MDRLNKIERLKDALHDGDYKVIKNYECTALGIALEYDASLLHTERQAIRDEINRLTVMTDDEYWEAYPEEQEQEMVVEPIEEEPLPENDEELSN